MCILLDTGWRIINVFIATQKERVSTPPDEEFIWITLRTKRIHASGDIYDTFAGYYW